MKEALFGALSNFLKADNFEGKRLFIRDFDGLAFLTRQICAEYPLRFTKKVLQLTNDLVINDDMIFGNDPNGDRFFVRRFFTHKDEVIRKLLKNILESDVDNKQELQLREYSLRVLFCLHQLEPKKLTQMIVEPLYLHRSKILAKLDGEM